MTRIRIIAALVATLALPAISHGIVDMKNSNYSDSWIDATLPGTGYALRVHRVYNSRSNFSGMFGFGWCSDFETSIERMPEGKLKLTECGDGQEVLFAPEKFQSANLDKVTNAIIEHYKKRNPRASKEIIEELRQQVIDDTEVRASWAADANLKSPELQKGTVFKADNLSVEQLEFTGDAYVRKLADGSSQRFDNSGRLTHMYDKNGNFLKLSWAGKSLREVSDNTNRKLSFTTYPNVKRVKEIIGPNSMKVEYKFKGEDLSEVRNMWKNTYTYQYDTNHNLVQINFPDKTFKAITYNQQRDWVTSFTDRAQNGQSCTETYKYEQNPSKELARDHFWSIATKKCGNEVVNEAKFEFFHKTRADGQKYLSRAVTKADNDTLDVTYHPNFGRPTIVKKNGVTTTFDYHASGLVKEKTTAQSRMVFEYKNAFNKVSKVTTEFFDDTGKVAKKRDTDFVYDSKANLASAKNSDGQSVTLAYDERGRIARIIDQAKKEVVIRYDEKTGKPGTITRPKLGSITVQYKPNGEIAKVESKDGPTVAVQIASTFNNLLDIIAPATSELSL